MSTIAPLLGSISLTFSQIQSIPISEASSRSLILPDTTKTTAEVTSIKFQSSTLPGISPTSSVIGLSTPTDNSNAPTIASESDMAQRNPVPVGAIAGSVVAGTIATLLALALTIRWRRRIRKRRGRDDVDLVNASDGLDVLESRVMFAQPYTLPRSPQVSQKNPSRALISKLNARQYISGSDPTGANIQVHQDTQNYFDPSASNSLPTYLNIPHDPVVRGPGTSLMHLVPQDADPQSALALSHLRLAAQVDALQNQLLRMQMNASTSHYFPDSSVEAPPRYVSGSTERSESDRTLFDEGSRETPFNAGSRSSDIKS